MLDGPTLGVLGDRGAALPVDPHERYYLMVFHGEASTCFVLPRTGSVTIGRSDEAHLRVDDHSVSRRHATLTMDHGEARIADLGSHNGVWVNDERVVASRLLFSGDAVTIGAATLVYHASGARPPDRRALEFPQLRQRLVEEVDRAARFSHDLAIVVVQLGGEVDRLAVDAALTSLVRGGGIVGLDIAGGVVVLVPETTASAAPEAAQAVLTAVLPGAPMARVGFACYPLDGSDPDDLSDLSDLIVAAYREYATVLTRLGRYAEAEKELDLAWSVFTADPAYGPVHTRSQDVVDAYVELYRAWGKVGRAAEWVARKAAPQGGSG